jgi:glycosyltransferase involved in cell wall biosynthesis
MFNSTSGGNRNLPKITVVTPSFNQAAFLEETIRSVLCQRYPNLEYFILDGGSKDRSVDIIKKYEQQLAGWVSKKDKGQSDAIDRGFSMGSGEILCWINSDDVLFPGALKIVGEYFCENSSVDVLQGGIAYADEKGNFTKYYVYPRHNRMFSDHGVIAFGQQSMFFRRATYEKIGGIRNDFHYLMDTDFVYRMIYGGVKFGTTRSMLGVFRWHGDMKSVNRGGRKAQETALVLSTYGKKRKQTRFFRYIFTIRQLLNGNYISGFFMRIRWRRKTISSLLGDQAC